MVAPICKQLFGRLCFLLIVWIRLTSTTATATLTTSYVGRPCPGELVTFTCTVPGVEIFWDPDDANRILINILSTESVTVGLYTATLLSSNATSITSTLSTTARDGVTVECETVGSVMIQVANPPSPPHSVSYTVRSSIIVVAIVSVEWDPPVDDERNELNYTVNISPFTQLSANVVTSTNVIVTADYNVNYTLTIVATNCAGDSMTVEYRLNVGACPLPTNLMDGVLFPVTSRTIGSTVTFQCEDGFMPTTDTTTCLNTLVWDPDPVTFACVPMTTTPPPTTAPPILCGLPQSPLNGSLGSHLLTSPLGTTVTFQCDDGLFPNDTMTTTCSNMLGSGEWNPDPVDLNCGKNPVNCGVPDEPLNGTILDYNNIATIEGSVISFQCNPGLSPEGVMTATCTNAGVWSPNPADVICKIITDASPQADSVIGVAVGVVVAFLFVMAIIVGVIIVTCLVRRGKAEKRGVESTQQNTPSGPVYEDILSPRREDIELETNQAYGQVRR